MLKASHSPVNPPTACHYPSSGLTSGLASPAALPLALQPSHYPSSLSSPPTSPTCTSYMQPPNPSLALTSPPALHEPYIQPYSPLATHPALRVSLPLHPSHEPSQPSRYPYGPLTSPPALLLALQPSH